MSIEQLMSAFHSLSYVLQSKGRQRGEKLC